MPSSQYRFTELLSLVSLLNFAELLSLASLYRSAVFPVSFYRLPCIVLPNCGFWFLLLVAVMAPALDNKYVVFQCYIDQPVFLIDAAVP